MVQNDTFQVFLMVEVNNEYIDSAIPLLVIHNDAQKI